MPKRFVNWPHVKKRFHFDRPNPVTGIVAPRLVHDARSPEEYERKAIVVEPILAVSPDAVDRSKDFSHGTE